MKRKIAAAMYAVALCALFGGFANAGSLGTGVWSKGSSQHLYVSDTDSHAVWRFSMRDGIPNQRPDAKIGGLITPRGIAIGPDGRLFVVDRAVEKLFIYKPYPRTGSKPDFVLNLPHPDGLAALSVDYAGFVYVGYTGSCGREDASLCGHADVYAPLPSGNVQPVASYNLGGGPPVPFVTSLAVNATHHLLTITGEQPNVFNDAPEHTNQIPFALFCPEAAYGGVWGKENTLYFTDTGKPANPPRDPQVYVVPNYLQDPHCPNFYSIKSATVPLKNPIGITQQNGLLYVTTAFNERLGSGVIFVFNASKGGSQTPVAIVGGAGAQLISPWGLAIGP